MIPISLGYSEGRSKSTNAGRCINVYPCINASDANAPITLSECPGLKRFVRPSSANGQLRGFQKVGGDLYSLVGDTFYKTNIHTLTSTSIGTVSSSTGKAWIEKNANSQILIAENNNGYIYNWGTESFGQISDADFPGAASLAFMNNYALVVKPGTGRLYNSAVNDFSDWNGTDFVTAQSDPDNLLAVVADHQEVVGLGEKTAEVYKDSGDADAVFQRLEGAIFEIGIVAPASVSKKANVFFWLDDSYQVRMMQAYSPRVISTPAISYQIAQLSAVEDGLGMSFIWNGRVFYALVFPVGNKTFIYDLTSSLASGSNIWHERSSYPFGGDTNRWRGNCIFQEGNTVYVGDFENGWIYTLDEDTHTDNQEEMRRTWTTTNIFDPQNHRNMFHHEIELKMEMGVGTDDVEEPQVMMRYSDDNGKTWSNEILEHIGSVGQYKNRARWHGLGESRDRIYEFSITDDVKCEVVGVFLRATMGRH